MKEFQYLIKDDEQISIKLYKVTVFSDDYYEFRAYNGAEDYIGYLTFMLHPRQLECELREIRVAPTYLNRGVGSSMSNIFEQFLLQNNCNNINGVYYPMGEGAIFTPAFYARNGYDLVDDDGYMGLVKEVVKKDQNVPRLIEYDTVDEFTYAPWEHIPNYSQEK